MLSRQQKIVHLVMQSNEGEIQRELREIKGPVRYTWWWWWTRVGEKAQRARVPRLIVELLHAIGRAEKLTRCRIARERRDDPARIVYFYYVKSYAQAQEKI